MKGEQGKEQAHDIRSDKDVQGNLVLVVALFFAYGVCVWLEQAIILKFSIYHGGFI
jgi:hypothetical protein